MTSTDTVLDPHDKMRARSVEAVAKGEQAPRPAHEPGSITDSPNPPPDMIREDPDNNTTIELKTAPVDMRFPFTNQTRHCYTRYIEYHRCIQAKGKECSDCEKFSRYYRSICPTDWIVEWNRQRELGIFPGPI